MGIQVYNKYESYDKKFTIAQDINGNMFVKCNECNQTMIGTMAYAKGRRRYNYYCPKCLKKYSITL